MGRRYYVCFPNRKMSIKYLMKELQEHTIEQIRILLKYLCMTDLLKYIDILMCLDLFAREYWGAVVNKN